MAEMLITITFIAFFCLIGLVVLLMPVIFLLVFLGGVARRRQHEQRMENMLEQQYLMLYLHNQQRLDRLTRPKPEP